MAPDVDLVVPEQLGSVVSLQRATRGAKGLSVGVTYPSAPGLYRLVVTLHNGSGIAYDAATQALLHPVIVRVGGPYTAAFGAPAGLALAAGGHTTIAVRVVNAGSQVWDAITAAPPVESDSLLSWLRTSRTPPRLVATWVSTAGIAVPVPASRALSPAAAKPGGTDAVLLGLDAPPIPGEYLLLLDVLTPTRGALSTLGSAPALVRVIGRRGCARRRLVTGLGPAPTAVADAGPEASGHVAYGSARIIPPSTGHDRAGHERCRGRQQERPDPADLGDVAVAPERDRRLGAPRDLLGRHARRLGAPAVEEGDSLRRDPPGRKAVDPDRARARR